MWFEEREVLLLNSAISLVIKPLVWMCRFQGPEIQVVERH